MATLYYDFSAAVNGNGASATPYNLTGWTATTVSAGNSYMFKRGTTLTTAFSTVAGTDASTLVSYGAWYNSDGSDDTSMPRPIIVTTSTFSSYSSSNKNYVSIDSWDIRAHLIPIASDTYVIFCGTGASITNCAIYSRCGCIGNFGKSNVLIRDNTLWGVSHGSAYSNCVLIVSDPTAMDTVTIQTNTIYHYGGGNSTSHATRIECGTAAASLTNLIVEGNVILPAPSETYLLPGYGIVLETGKRTAPLSGRGTVNEDSILNPATPLTPSENQSAIGMWLARCPFAIVRSNVAKGFLDGIFFNGGGTATTGVTLSHNVTTYNRHFGIHITSDTTSAIIEYNNCSYNGTSTYNGVLLAYGRGIELSSTSGQGSCTTHTIRFNLCEYNKNYGGPNDNASEGCGIGLDDGTTNNTVYGNVLRNNEGNGIQLYGGGNTATWTDTHNYVVANYFSTNCTAAFKSRRTGGTLPTLFCAHLQASGTYGAPSHFLNNVFAGTTSVAIAIDSGSDRITNANNIFLDVPHCVMMPTTGAPTGVTFTRNNFYSNLVMEQLYCSNTVNGSGSPTFPDLAYTGTSDYTFNPLLDSDSRPLSGSPAINAGFTVGAYYDTTGHAFDTPPTLGMYEYIGPRSTYYVSTTGNDSNTGLTTAGAVLTISKGATLVRAGDTLSVLPGNYQGPIVIDSQLCRNGTSSYPVTLVSSTRGGAGIRALIAPVNNRRLAALEIGPDSWVIDGFEITGEDGYTNTADTTWNYNISTEWCYGVFLAGSNCTVKNCYIHDLARGSVPAQRGGAAVFMDFTQIGGSNRAYWNIVYRIGSTVSGSKANGIFLGSTACEAQSNVVGNVTGACVAADNVATNVVVANNTLFNAVAGLKWGQAGTGAAAPWLHSSVAFNNIILDCSYGVLESGNIGAGNLINQNMFFGCNSNLVTTATMAGNVSLSPTFVNYISTGNGDYHLSVGSAAINTGTSSCGGILALTTDLSAVSRSSTVDLGAFEFFTASTTTQTQLERSMRKRLRRK